LWKNKRNGIIRHGLSHSAYLVPDFFTYKYDQKQEKMNVDACEINRWELLRRQLNNLDQQHFEELVKAAPDAVILDVRTQSEFEAEHLPGAIHMDYFGPDLIEQMDALDKTKPYLIYCRSGRRSVRVCVLMRNSGFKEVYNLDGGIKAWQ